MSSNGLRVVTWERVTNGWYLIRFGWVTSTGALRVLSAHIGEAQTRKDTSEGDRLVTAADLRQKREGASDGVLEQLTSIWLLRTFRGGRVGRAMQMYRLKGRENIVMLLEFVHRAVQRDIDATLGYFSGRYDVGIISRKDDCPAILAPSSTIDRELDVIAASVDGIDVFLNIVAFKPPKRSFSLCRWRLRKVLFAAKRTCRQRPRRSEVMYCRSQNVTPTYF